MSVTLSGPETPPAPLGTASAGVCLTLLDFETPLWLDRAAATAQVRDYLRFHCGVPLVEAPADARFALIADATADAAAVGLRRRHRRAARPLRHADRAGQWTGVRPRASAERARASTGEARLEVDGTPPGFWDAVRANAARFPRGVDLFLCAGDRIAALPRTTRVED